MSATSLVSSARPQRRRFAAAGLLLLLAVAVLGACSSQITAYSDKVRNNFVSGCTKPANGADKAAALPEPVCRCIYSKITADNGLSFNEFKKVQDQLRDKKKSLEQLNTSDAKKILGYRSACEQEAAAKATASTSTTVAGSSTTVAGSSTTVAGSSTTVAGSSTTVAGSSSSTSSSSSSSSSSSTSTTKAP
jgi:hypothetical protein